MIERPPGIHCVLHEPTAAGTPSRRWHGARHARTGLMIGGRSCAARLTDHFGGGVLGVSGEGVVSEGATVVPSGYLVVPSGAVTEPSGFGVDGVDCIEESGIGVLSVGVPGIFDEQVPNMASGVQSRLGAEGCAALDINTACTSFLYGLSTATAMIRSGVVRNALVIGAELISPFMDWMDRNVAVLFGDGAAAVVLEATDAEEGLLAEKLGCYGDAREILRVHGMGGRYANKGMLYGVTRWQFEGQEIFKRAVQGMSGAAEEALAKTGRTAADVDLVVPHQANLRIIEAVARRTQLPMDRVYVNVQRYGNMSSATVPVALCEALEEGRVKPGGLLLLPGFGGGLSFCAHVVRWGNRLVPLSQSDVELPPAGRSALEIVRELMAAKTSSRPAPG